MINVNDLKNNFDDRINYPKQGSYTLDQLNRWMFLASQGLFRQRQGLPEQAEFQTAVSLISYARTRKIHEDLRPFRVFKNIPISGEVLLEGDYPTDINLLLVVSHISYVLDGDNDHLKKLRKCDCRKYDSILVSNPKYKAYIGEVKYMDETAWAGRVNSSYLKKAIFIPYSDQWLFHFPVQPSVIKVEYLKNPVQPRWAYTQAADGTEIYDATRSINLEWNEVMMYDLVSRMAKLYGENIADQFVTQTATADTKKGE